MSEEYKAVLLEENDTREIIDYMKLRVSDGEIADNSEFIMYWNEYLKYEDYYNPRDIRIRKINYTEEWISLKKNDTEIVGMAGFYVKFGSPVIRLNFVHIKQSDYEALTKYFNKMIDLLKENVVSNISKLRVSLIEQGKSNIWEDTFKKLGFQPEVKRKYGNDFTSSCIDYVYYL